MLRHVLLKNTEKKADKQANKKPQPRNHSKKKPYHNKPSMDYDCKIIPW